MENKDLIQKLKEHTKAELLEKLLEIHKVGDEEIQTIIEAERPESSSFFMEGDIVDLLVIRPLNRALRCKVINTCEAVTFRKKRFEVPGDTITIKVSKHWKNKNTSYISGERIKKEFILSNLNLKPIKIEKYGAISRSDCLLDDEHPERIRDIFERIFIKKEYSVFEIENIIPGVDYNDIEDDPIFKSVEMKNSGKVEEATEILLNLLEKDFRCIDAFSHLGNLHFPENEESTFVDFAIPYYEAGVKIGEYFLGPDFEGQLPWGYLDNRPYLRALHGLGLCYMRKGNNKKALDIFEKLLRLNHMDNLGARFLIDEILQDS
ncbi:MAG: tetratricopeptide repeat protein [Spirochaetota bacterium]|nr:tetratricopeptide repeat protein [Spirochaetota bacterium]